MLSSFTSWLKNKRGFMLTGYIKYKQIPTKQLLLHLLQLGGVISSATAILLPLPFSSSSVSTPTHCKFPLNFNHSFNTHSSHIQPHSVSRFRKMGLSAYQSPSDAGVLCVILVNTAISISIMKDRVRSILHVIGIHVASGEDYSGQTLSVECRGTPSETYMEEFRSRTPSILYDCLTKQECSVCLVEFKLDAEINRLSCGHVFHKSCVEKWLKLWNVTCPLCRNHMMMPIEAEENTCPM